jgi:hypothetical protein
LAPDLEWVGGCRASSIIDKTCNVGYFSSARSHSLRSEDYPDLSEAVNNFYIQRFT